MRSKELSKSFDNNDTYLHINNVLDFSFGEDNIFNKCEDIIMTSNDSKSNINEEKKERIFINKEKDLCPDDSKIRFSPCKCNNNIFYDFPEKTQFLISKKRKRKNEIFIENIRLSKSKNLFKNNDLNIKKMLLNTSFKKSVNKSNKDNKFENMMNIKEDSLGNNSCENSNDTLDIVPNSKEIKFNNDFVYFLNKFNKINLNIKA